MKVKVTVVTLYTAKFEGQDNSQQLVDGEEKKTRPTVAVTFESINK